MVKLARGRPKASTELGIRKELWDRFVNGDSPIFASNESGHNLKTVYKYYQEFREELQEHMDDNFVLRQKAAKEIALAGLDRDIKAIEKEIEKMTINSEDEPDNSDWSRLKHALLVNLANIRQQKADLEMTPTIDVSLEDLAEEYLGEKDDDKTQSSKSTTPKK